MIIGHYEHDIWSPGGVASYIRRIGAAQSAAGHTVYYFSLTANPTVDAITGTRIVADEAQLFQEAKQLGVDLLHLHATLQQRPPQDLPVIRTVHGHNLYCPSGSRYFKRWGKACDRVYHPLGCAWGHLVDRCGSLRPHNLVQNFQRIGTESRTMQGVPLIAVSDFIKQQLIQAGYDADLIRVLRHFSTSHLSPSLPPQTATPRFVFLGRLVPEKGVPWILRSLQQVKANVHLDIAGEGYQEAEIRQLIDQLELTDRVTLHGWLHPEQSGELLQAARGLIFSSLWHEPAGIVPLEAMAQGRAIIGSDVGGISEVVWQGVNGLVVPPNDTISLAAAIDSLADDWQFATELGQNGRRILAEQFSLEQHLQQLMQIYQDSISNLVQSSLPVSAQPMVNPSVCDTKSFTRSMR